ncbi:TetR/AcrR family transcriptional regulator [Leptospira idonii]|uniref:TetR/AcrR family transcriptional regulator n=1 Tax=Leptospira idonii TaxID=1193500 RepID=A0A4R9M517_9LEPT|nr:TetR/AcrR family transcriptional regulator [Leptospira idonii]TGN19818.1 TetR/AcrR family transcriptional regulator [Leptospira idonii]
MPRTGLSPEEIREKATDAAEERIRRHGFDKFRLVDIAKDLDVSHVALYKHFPDKSALLDSVSERWLLRMDEALLKVTEKKKSAKDLLWEWFLLFHQLKKEKVQTDPELYKAFDNAAEAKKTFVIKHVNEMHRQLEGILRKALDEKSIQGESASSLEKVFFESTVGFHHPKLVYQHLTEKREKLLKQVLETLWSGAGGS